MSPEPARRGTASRPGSRGRAGRRVDPQGRQALFSGGPAAAPDHLTGGAAPDGRHALYSSGPHRPGTAVVACSACASRTRLALADLGLRLLAGSLWVPGRRHSRWMRCPACHRHTWCRVGWTD